MHWKCAPPTLSLRSQTELRVMGEPSLSPTILRPSSSTTSTSRSSRSASVSASEINTFTSTDYGCVLTVRVYPANATCASETPSSASTNTFMDDTELADLYRTTLHRAVACEKKVAEVHTTKEKGKSSKGKEKEREREKEREKEKSRGLLGKKLSKRKHAPATASTLASPERQRKQSGCKGSEIIKGYLEAWFRALNSILAHTHHHHHHHSHHQQQQQHHHQPQHGQPHLSNQSPQGHCLHGSSSAVKSTAQTGEEEREEKWVERHWDDLQYKALPRHLHKNDPLYMKDLHYMSGNTEGNSGSLNTITGDDSYLSNSTHELLCGLLEREGGREGAAGEGQGEGLDGVDEMKQLANHLLETVDGGYDESWAEQELQQIMARKEKQETEMSLASARRNLTRGRSKSLNGTFVKDVMSSCLMGSTCGSDTTNSSSWTKQDHRPRADGQANSLSENEEGMMVRYIHLNYSTRF